jgi:hypothetical protein
MLPLARRLFGESSSTIPSACPPTLVANTAAYEDLGQQYIGESSK